MTTNTRSEGFSSVGSNDRYQTINRHPEKVDFLFKKPRISLIIQCFADESLTISRLYFNAAEKLVEIKEKYNLS